MRKQLLFILFLLVLASSAAGQEELAGYEVVNNSQIGLSVAPFEKWGVASGDIDRNGWPDIFTIRWASPGHSALYLNNNGLFSDITSQTPLQDVESNEPHTTTVSLVDFDNDGDRDIFFGTDKNIYLLQNDDNTFSEISESVGLDAGKPPGFVATYQFRMGAWADFDLDGDLDLVIGQQNNPDLLFYKNDGGVFMNVAPELGFTGIATHQGPLDIPQGSRRTRHLTWIDFDMDGDPDLNVGGLIYRNDGGTFTDITESTGFNPTMIEAADWFDYDNDGDLDYFKSVVTGHYCELWENRDGVMVDVSLETGVSIDDAFRGITIGDYDNDGDQDILVQNNNSVNYEVLLLNEELEPGVHSFADVAQWIGLDKMGDRKGAAFLDYDMDGFLDLYVASAEHNHIMYHNLTIPTNNWVGFILEGTESNRDAIGALIKLYSGGKMQIRYTKVPSSWQCQDNPYVHFGLGESANIDSVIIRWPLGRVEVLSDVAVNQYHDIVEAGNVAVAGKGDSRSVPARFSMDQNYPNPFNAETTISYQLLQPGVVRVIIANLLGESVRQYEMIHSASGKYAFTWDGQDKYGMNVPSGVYMVKAGSGDSFIQKKMIMLK